MRNFVPFKVQRTHMLLTARSNANMREREWEKPINKPSASCGTNVHPQTLNSNINAMSDAGWPVDKVSHYQIKEFHGSQMA